MTPELSVCTAALSVRQSACVFVRQCGFQHAYLHPFSCGKLYTQCLFLGPKGERGVISHCFSAVLQRAVSHDAVHAQEERTDSFPCGKLADFTVF